MHEELLQQIKHVLSYVHESVRTQFKRQQQCYDNYHQQLTQSTANLYPLAQDYTLSKKALQTYTSWLAHVRATYANPQEEFCLQTAYFQFVRIFFICACQQYDLLPLPASGETSSPSEQFQTELLSNIEGIYHQLISKIYPQALSDYNSPGQHKFFDWFTADPHTTLSLLALLHRYDFQALNTDVLGRIYSESYIEKKGRSETGQFYTPPHIVEYMLDTLGISGYNDYGYTKNRAFLEKTVGDLSCGSGSFLVAVASRKSAILRRLVATHELSRDYALQVLTNTFLGFDLNPFACYIAEINLLIQCLPFLLNEQGELCCKVEQFHIYYTDVLDPAVKLTEFGASQQGIDYLVGNPPYVSANESADNLLYRDKISRSGIYHLLYQRWDLFVPFFERNLQFLRSETGRLGLIVSNGIETEGYAERLRQHLLKHFSLLQIDFFPKLRLFQNAAVESTMVFIENREPAEGHEVVRRKHLQTDCRHFETLPPVRQLTSNGSASVRVNRRGRFIAPSADLSVPSRTSPTRMESPSNGQVFRWRYDPILDKNLAEGTILLCAIAYIGTGIEAQSKEMSDPLIDGKRQKRFTLNDVFLPSPAGAIRPAEYVDDGVLGDDIDCYYLRRKRYVAYEKYLPEMRGPRYISLFRTPEKLLLGETSGGYYDRDGLFANHSVQLVVSWKVLEQAGATEQRGIQRVLRKSQQMSGFHAHLAAIAGLFDLRYLLAIINSCFIRDYIVSNLHEGTRKGRIYPDVWKRLPIKVASRERQRQIAMLIEAVQEEYRKLPALSEVEEQEIRTNINKLLLQIEMLVETTYREPADLEMMRIIME